jgi:caffeoyl-CoA O-methyltransferase
MELIAKDIESYCIAHSTLPGQLARELQLYTLNHVHGSQMLIGEMEASVLGFLIKLGRVKKVLEFGTFTGYSALAMAEALPTEGKLITIDINAETTAIAKSFWARSPHNHKIESRMGSGLQVMAQLQENFDLIFIDADKNNYLNYLKWALEHLNPGGMVVTDNTLWSGRVLEGAAADKQTQSIQQHNSYAAELKGYTCVLLPIRDGMFLIRKDAD